MEEQRVIVNKPESLKKYSIDFKKVNSMEQLIRIIDALGIVVDHDSVAYNKIKDLLKDAS